MTERRFGIKYTVLDDLRPYILPQFLDPKVLKDFMPYMDMIYGKNHAVRDLLRPLRPHEIDLKCLKSVNMHAPPKKKRQSYFFKSVPRAKGVNHMRKGVHISSIPCSKQELEKARAKSLAENPEPV